MTDMHIACEGLSEVFQVIIMSEDANDEFNQPIIEAYDKRDGPEHGGDDGPYLLHLQILIRDVVYGQRNGRPDYRRNDLRPEIIRVMIDVTSGRVVSFGQRLPYLVPEGTASTAWPVRPEMLAYGLLLVSQTTDASLRPCSISDIHNSYC